MRGLKRCGVSLRARALQKLCEAHGSDESPLSKLLDSLPISYSSNVSKLYSIPLALKEFEIIVAVSDSSPKDAETIETIIHRLMFPYFVDSGKQKFSDVVQNRFKNNGFKNPLEVLSYKMTLFLMRASNNQPELRDKVNELFEKYLQNISSSLDVNSLISFLGFLEAVSDGLQRSEVITEFHWNLIFNLIQFMNTSFLLKAETVLTQSVSNDILVDYFDNHREVCALRFVHLLAKIQVNLLLVLFNVTEDENLSEYLLKIQDLEYQEQTDSERYIKFKSAIRKYAKHLNKITSNAAKIISSMDDGAPYMNLQSYNTVSIAYACKVSNMEIQTFALFIEESESAILSTTLTNVVYHEVEALQGTIRLENPELLKIIINIAALMNFYTDKVSTPLLIAFPLIVSSQYITAKLVTELSANFAIGLKPLSEDSIVGTIYSLNNLLGVTKDASPISLLKERSMTVTDLNDLDKMFPRQRKANTFNSLNDMRVYLGNDADNNSTTSLLFNRVVESEEKMIFDTSKTHYHDQLFKNAVMACVTVARYYGDQSITALAVTILTQKFKALSPKSDQLILQGLGHILPFVAENEFKMLCKFFNSVSLRALKDEDTELLDAMLSARSIISEQLKKNVENTSYFFYLRSILDVIISRGDVEKLEHHRSHHEISKVAEQIAFFLKPLASLLPVPGKEQSIRPLLLRDATTTCALRNIWFNMIIHGFHSKSELATKYQKELKIIAYNSPPLVSDFPSNNKETTLEMNTILRRGSSNHNLKDQKSAIQQILSSNVIASRTMSTTKIMFVAASFFLECIRCDIGDCSTILEYFSDTSVSNSNLDKFIGSIAINLTHRYLGVVPVGEPDLFCSKKISEQLTRMFLMLTHRDLYLQDCAFQCCDVFIRRLPSSLCHHDSLYTLLDSLTMLFDSIADFETRKYDPRFEFTLKTSGIRVLLTDSEDWRKSSFNKLVEMAREWTRILLRTSNQDGKILLQSYITDVTNLHNTSSVEYGVSFALEMAGTILSADRELSKLGYTNSNIQPNTLSGFLSQHAWRSKILTERNIMSSSEDINSRRINLRNEIVTKLVSKREVDDVSVMNFLSLCGALLIMRNGDSASLIFDLVSIPFQTFHGNTMKVATNVWLSFIKERKDLAHLLVSEIATFWFKSIDEKFGLYNCKDTNKIDVEFMKMEYKPYDMNAIKEGNLKVSNILKPHLQVIKFFASHFEATVYESDHLLKLFTHVAYHGVSNLEEASTHPFARSVRNELIRFAMLVLLVNEKKHTSDSKRLAQAIIKGGLSWFKARVSWPVGGNEAKIKADLSLMIDLYQQMRNNSKLFVKYTGNSYILLEYFMLHEVFTLRTWLKPFDKQENGVSKLPTELLSHAFSLDCRLAVNICERYSNESKYIDKLGKMIKKNPLDCCHVHTAMSYLLKECNNGTVPHEVIYWVPVSPLASINLFLPPWNKNKFLLQYNLRALESHDVENTFFYVPQIVQCLRHDEHQYVGRFILDTAKINLQFSHQIIWNILANEYQDDEGTIADAMKPTLERIREKMISMYDADAKTYYEREFSFFDDVTSISGKLKPYIKKTKAEKKMKIDEEIAKIQIEKDVYLPSNPDGVVVDIDRKKGKPLQSHAKAPFMATFKVKKQHGDKLEDRWISAIFKVGDDCRQDVLALQLVSLFRSIWSYVGLDVYVFPYRVTATAPGCGIIDVLPNSISRDMLGREAVNGLYEYFISKFGSESSIEFQRARNNFVKSLAAYSVISYLLQFKDRHNGNIMYDNQGHCLHIDFGFIFDIVPGGVKFEAVPFKLTKEMVRVMGGSQSTQAFTQFQDLCVSTFLAVRPYMHVIIDCIVPMLESSLPCFKAEKTIKNLRARFVPNKSPQEASQHMRQLIRRSYESMFTKGYDEFQRLTNGIPY